MDAACPHFGRSAHRRIINAKHFFSEVCTSRCIVFRRVKMPRKRRKKRRTQKRTNKHGTAWLKLPRSCARTLNGHFMGLNCSPY